MCLVMSKKGWKDHLLSSGVPLEYSVRRVFEELGIRQPEEFKYERKNADGVPQVFSVDIVSTGIDLQRRFWVESLVECKYRHDGTKWVFTPMEYQHDIYRPRFRDLFVTLDQCCPDKKLDPTILNDLRDYFPLCGKGIELLPEDTNPKSIEQAVKQLRYGVIAKTVDALIHQIDKLLGDFIPIFVFLPIIVTTAELWRLKTNTTIEEIRAAEEISNVADRHDFVVLMEDPDNLDRRYTTTLLQESLDADQQAEMNRLLQETMKQTFPFFVDHFSAYVPSLFLVISYERFSSAMVMLHKFFGKDGLVQARGV